MPLHLSKKSNESLSVHPYEPIKDCRLCPRLVDFRHDNQTAYPDFFNGAVSSFGPMNAKHLIVGLAPGLKGANKTGRPFTGDFSGELLYRCLDKMGWTSGDNKNEPQDGYDMTHTLITNAVRCVPPQNKPTAEEVKNCRPFLMSLIENMPHVKTMLALGKVAHDTIMRTYGLRLADHKFVHKAVHHLPGGIWLVDSYHCSRYNVNTGVLTEKMFLEALAVMEEVSLKSA
ncbi:MAG: uracil-DNA glycosylase [Kordiimonadaceae bacterium]|nr:uracil-DNA glycosylase [Kordiimonadaceae bacterium]